MDLYRRVINRCQPVPDLFLGQGIRPLNRDGFCIRISVNGGYRIKLRQFIFDAANTMAAGNMGNSKCLFHFFASCFSLEEPDEARYLPTDA
jgi:hypothetical protein